MVSLASELPVTESISATLAAQQSHCEADALICLTRIAKIIDARNRSKRTRPFLYAAAVRLVAGLDLLLRRRALAVCRIENSRRYALRHEYGAATYELSQFQRLVSRGDS